MHSLLKEKIVEIHGAPVSSARECEVLAKNISVRTGRSISSSTLRRYFGLLNSSSSISTYNLDTLSIYCGAPDFNSFSEVVRRAEARHVVYDIHLFDRMKEISRYTMKSIERKTLGGFERTIPRFSLNRKLNVFLQASDYTIFPLIAPGGYGKSIALAHWVKEIEDDTACIFCRAELFLSVLEERGSFRNSVKLRLDDPGNIFNAFCYGQQEQPPSLVMVIDALDEISYDPKRLLSIVDYLFDAASLYSKERSVKFVFSIREATWQIYLGERSDRLEANQWYEQISPLLDTGYSNLPQLSNSEIHEIIDKQIQGGDNPFIFECIPWDLRELLRIPIQLHFVSRLYQKVPTLEHLSKTDVIRGYLVEFLFGSRHAEEKEDIVWKILGMMDDKGNHLPVMKSDLKKAFPVHLKRETNYYHAYQELLSDGIIIEEREENAYGIFVTRVGFRHINFYVYLHALYLIRTSGELSFLLIDSIVRMKSNDALINDIIATLYQVAYDAENLEALKDFCTLPERILYSLPVRLTVGASFRKANTIREDLVAIYAASAAGRKYFFEQYVDTNYLYNNYVMRIREYKKYKTGKEADLFTNAIFYMAAFMKMDKDACIHHAALMEATEPDTSVHPWPIGRKVYSQLLQTAFVEGETDNNFHTYLKECTKIAHSFPGYLERGLIEFEMYIILGMVLTQDFEGLYRMLDRVALQYGVRYAEKNSKEPLRRIQNAIPRYFLEYAIYKLNYKSGGRSDLLWSKAIDRYSTNFDDYQFLILMNWFLVDYLVYNNQPAEALKYYDAALHIARIAGYDFFEAFLLVNDPLKDEERMHKGESMIAASGFAREMFTFPIGPCA